MDEFAKDVGRKVLDLIKAYHQYDPYDGDSCVLFEEVRMMRFVAGLIEKDEWSGPHWKLASDEGETIVFSDMHEENCVLTTDPQVFDNQPKWVGLKIKF